jgi:hypothetical protein
LTLEADQLAILDEMVEPARDFLEEIKL